MMNKIIRFSIENRGLVFVFTALFMVMGWMTFKHLSIDALPDITNVQVSVNTLVEGLAPEEAERYITIPIESAMNGIANVTDVRSLTKFGLSQVIINFEDGVDIYKARQQVSERLQSVQADLPPGVNPRLGPITTGIGEIYMYTVEADHPASGEERVKQLMELRATQEWLVAPRLMTVKGLAGVDSSGGYEKQYHIQPDIGKMTEYGLDFDEIETALEKANKNVGGGYIQQQGQQYLVQGIGLFQSPAEIARVPVKSLETLKTVTIGDIATVTLGSSLRMGASLVDGKEAVVGTALLLSGENSREVALAVDQKIQEIKKLLPAGIHITTLLSRSDLVNATLRTVLHNLIIGAMLVVIILLLLVGNLRAALITAFIIPLSLLFTFILMHWRGISGNLMSLGALDFGIIIDAAVIVLENCVRRLNEKTKVLGHQLTSKELKTTIVEATIEMRQASGFGQLIIIAVFLPIFALTGIEGKMFQPMAASFTFALLGALIFSFTTAPALASVFLKGSAKEHDPWLMRVFQRIYKPTLQWAVLRPYQVIAGAVFLLVVALGLFSHMGTEFLPQLNEGSIVVIFNRDVNIGINAAIAMESKSDQLIATFPEVKQVFSRIGTAEVATDPMGINGSDTFVILKQQHEWPEVNGHRRTKEELTQAIASELRKKLPDQGFILSQPIQERFNEILEGLRADVSVKIFDDDLARLLEMSETAEELLQKVPGAGSVEAEMSATSHVLRIVPKDELLARFGIGNDVVLEAISTAIGGREVGFLFEGVRRFPIVIRLNESDRSNLDAVKKIPVEVGPNLTMRLDELADINFVEGFGSILRENNKRRAAIMMDDPHNRDTLSFVNEAKKMLEAKILLPEGSYFEWGGNFKNLEQAQERLLFLIPIVLVLVFLMIYAAFRDVLQTCLIFSGIPLALVGGVLALKVNGLIFSISAGIGFIALSGIAILNGVVLISYFNQLQEEGLLGQALVIKGSLVRLRPVLMTALVDVFGFLPMMISRGVGAEVQKPLATVVIGGVISSTLLTLVVLPTMYLWLMKKRNNS